VLPVLPKATECEAKEEHTTQNAKTKLFIKSPFELGRLNSTDRKYLSNSMVEKY
jgi:hypothetical protein